ncbi:unnamed protein product [Calypogeia fissa]
MAFVRKEQKELDGLGPTGILREAFKLSTTHSRFFTLIQITLLLPLSALAVTCEYCFYWALYKDGNLPPDWHQHRFHAVDFTVFLRYGTFGFDLGITWAVVLLVMAGFRLGLTPILSIPSSAIIYSVGLHFKGQRVSFWDAISASTPRLCERLTMTTMYKTCLSYSMLIMVAVNIILLGNPPPILVLWIVPFASLVPVALVCLEIIFRLAAAVSVLDREFGWRALSRSWNLLKDRETVAIWFELLWLGTTIMLLGFQFTFRYHIARWGTPPWCLGLVYMAFMSFLWQMNALVSGIQYLSFKAYHEEAQDAELSFNYGETAMKGEYELVRSDNSDGIGQQPPIFFQNFGTTTVFIID